ncbi:MAG: hypothetical protein ABL964_04305 [Steroidobacteraceae bacterium]
MSKRLLPLISALVAIGVSQAAETPRLQALEQAIEVSSASIRVPDRAPSSFIVRSCETCPALTLQLTQATRFLLGKTAATQTGFNLALQQADPDPTLGIFYDSKTSEVTRLVAFGVGNKPATSTKSRRGK